MNWYKRSQSVEDFTNLGLQQRKKPEDAMIDAQFFHSGLWTHLLEHVGDLTHRMTEHVNFGGGFESSKEKINRAINYLDNGYFGRSFEEAHDENIVNNSGANGIAEEDYRNRIKEYGERYAQEHAQLPAYNEALQKARDAAVALGRLDFEGARANLIWLKNLSDKGERVWNIKVLEGMRSTLKNNSSFSPRKIKESNVVGEWWITDTGESLYADGDAGSDVYNHEMHVLDQIVGEYFDASLMDFDFSSLTEDDFNRVGMPQEAKDVLQGVGKGDARDYGMEHLGWIRVADRYIQTQYLSKGILQRIADGLFNAYDREVYNSTYVISCMSNGRNYSPVPFSVIESGSLTALRPYAENEPIMLRGMIEDSTFSSLSQKKIRRTA
jgi:hypothetical protein